MATVEGG